MLKSTPLESRHIALGAKMVEFAGYNMPVVYTSIQEEHHAVRNAVGVFDVSHMGEFILKGKDALALIQRISSNDASTLAIGQAQYACLPNEIGGIVDDMLVYHLPGEMIQPGEEAYMLVVNASNIDKDWEHIQHYARNFDVRLINISDETGLIAVQGPKAAAILQPLTDIKLNDIPYYHFVKGRIAGIDNVLISATGYTGAGGFELYVENTHLDKLWDTIMAIKDPVRPMPAGLGARDTLRLEMGYCLYGNDIDDTTSVLEAGLGWITKLKKTSEFPSKDYFIEQKKEGLNKKLVGFIVEDRRVPRHGYPVCNEAGDEIGVVTSGTLSPTLQIPIGMAYVPVKYSTEGSTFKVKAGGKSLQAKVVPVPFVKATT
ncbi:MAG TPA: glycine cleavage system aminomethyltransferase GcvT [Saprospiraceae bacterium]|nr:glycine cleavage system aminomethyltransferase GcvT [Saprospiraceae bacterium]